MKLSESLEGMLSTGDVNSVDICSQISHCPTLPNGGTIGCARCAFSEKKKNKNEFKQVIIKLKLLGE